MRRPVVAVIQAKAGIQHMPRQAARSPADPHHGKPLEVLLSIGVLFKLMWSSGFSEAINPVGVPAAIGAV